MVPRIIPEAGRAPNVSHDAQKAYATLKSGGVIIAPTDVGYALMTSTQAGIQRTLAAKDRLQGHNIGIIGMYRQHLEIHLLPESNRDIAKFDTKRLHLRLAALDLATLSQVIQGDTVSIAVPEGPFLRELGRLCDADPRGMLMFGTSANRTGQGQQFRVEDILPAVLACVDLVVDYGLQKWHVYGRGAVNLRRRKHASVAHGSRIRDVQRQNREMVPPPIGRCGHLDEDPEHRIREPRSRSKGSVKEWP